MPTHDRPEAIVAALIDAATSHTLGTNLFSGPPRPANDNTGIPQNCIFAFSLLSFQPQTYMNNQKDTRRFRVTVLVRYQPDSFETGQGVARDIWEAVNRADISAYPGFISALAEESDPQYLGQDDLDNHRWELNFRLIYVG